MTRQFSGADTRPWYRQFWPWFLILLPASVVVAGLSTLYIANRHADDLVVDDYYKDGLAINRQLEKKQRANVLGITAQLTFKHDLVSVLTTGPVGSDELRLFLSHPLEADRDFSVWLLQIHPGLFTGVLEQVVAPRWHWILEVPGPNGWRLDGEVLVDNIDGDMDSNAASH